MPSRRLEGEVAARVDRNSHGTRVTRRQIAGSKSEDTHEMFCSSLSVSRSRDTPRAG